VLLRHKQHVLMTPSAIVGESVSDVIGIQDHARANGRGMLQRRRNERIRACSGRGSRARHENRREDARSALTGELGRVQQCEIRRRAERASGKRALGYPSAAKSSVGPTRMGRRRG
jgi:hypothetical protein